MSTSAHDDRAAPAPVPVAAPAPLAGMIAAALLLAFFFALLWRVA